RFAPTQRIVIVAVAGAIGLLSPLSSNLYTPAVPAVARDLDVSTDAVNLTITSYLVLQGVSPTLWSAVGDSTGRRLLYLAALAVYLASCVGLALSRDYPAVVALRAVQAVGSASTTAIGASLIGDLIHVSRRVKYMGSYSALGGPGTAFGPVGGGLFAQYTGWRGMFVFLAALAACLLLFTALLLPETKRGIVGDGSVRPPSYLRVPLKWLDAPKSDGEANGAKAGARFRIDIGAPVRLLVEPECLCIVVFTGICYTVWQVTMVATATLYAERYGLDEMSIGLRALKAVVTLLR
ncbi:MFS general substrate transporter, partial [Colletotrichum falcatum]